MTHKSFSENNNFDLSDLKGEDNVNQSGNHHHYFNLTSIHLPHVNRHEIEVLPNAVTYLLYILLPLHISMVTIGFLHKDDCPADMKIPRYLFFGGLAGLMAALLRIIMVIKWKSIHKTQGIKYDPDMHPGLSMVRTVVYIFLIFIVVWHVNASLNIFNAAPDMENPESGSYCHPTVFKFSYVLVILFDAFFGLGLLIWVIAIVAGICNPDFLVLYGYYPSTNEITFRKKSKKKQRKQKSIQEERLVRKSRDDSEIDEEEMISTVLEKARHFNLQSSDKQRNRLKELHERNHQRKALLLRKSNSERLSTPTTGQLEVLEKKVKEQEALQAGDSDDSEDDMKHTLSIVRFAREVNSRRISVDYHKSSDKLDITNFPSGPLFGGNDHKEGDKKDRD